SSSRRRRGRSSPRTPARATTRTPAGAGRRACAASIAPPPRQRKVGWRGASGRIAWSVLEGPGSARVWTLARVPDGAKVRSPRSGSGGAGAEGGRGAAAGRNSLRANARRRGDHGIVLQQCQIGASACGRILLDRPRANAVLSRAAQSGDFHPALRRTRGAENSNVAVTHRAVGDLGTDRRDARVGSRGSLPV